MLLVYCKLMLTCYPGQVLKGVYFVFLQVRAMMTESAFSIEELEELYCLFKVRNIPVPLKTLVHKEAEAQTDSGCF